MPERRKLAPEREENARLLRPYIVGICVLIMLLVAAVLACGMKG